MDPFSHMTIDLIASCIFCVFSAGGAKQITYDIVTNLIPVLNSLYESHSATVTFDALDSPVSS